MNHSPATAHETVPHLLWTLPFIALLLSIAIFPLIHRLAHWWEKNTNKLLVAGVLGAVTLAYYLLRGYGIHGSEAGAPAVAAILHHAIIGDYFPFIVLLFSLYTISGGIHLRGDIPAHPLTNTAFLAIGGLLASVIGTTGASMLLIRPLLQTNRERKNVKHTVIFFILIVSNCGGLLLPLGDPPLFLGYLRGVPFLWTLHLLPEWILANVYLLAVYFVWDSFAHKHEAPMQKWADETIVIPLQLMGKRNLLLLGGVVLAVALLVPGHKFVGSSWTIPNIFLREWIQLGLAALSLYITPKEARRRNEFNFTAIAEVACLFIGIFLTMQVPIEILQLEGPKLGLTKPWQFFWASGILSSFLDNAPTYVVYFTTAGSLAEHSTNVLNHVMTATGSISVSLLTAISLGSVFMGANTYIGNGPNFMVKSIAEQSGVKMPSFFGYMVYSILILMPLYVVIHLFFLPTAA